MESTSIATLFQIFGLYCKYTSIALFKQNIFLDFPLCGSFIKIYANGQLKTKEKKEK